MAAAALRPAILRHIRLSPSPAAPLSAAAAAAQSHALARWLARPMSSHDAHLTRGEVVDRLLDVLKSHPKVDPSKVTLEAHFEKDLGLDSLDTVEVVMAIEEEFKLEIPDGEADKMTRSRSPSTLQISGVWDAHSLKWLLVNHHGASSIRREPELRSTASDLLKHPFVTGELDDLQPLNRTAHKGTKDDIIMEI